jgi:hypothetical protein
LSTALREHLSDRMLLAFSWITVPGDGQRQLDREVVRSSTAPARP